MKNAKNKGTPSSKNSTPQPVKTKKMATPKQTPKSENKKNSVKFENDSDKELTAADIEAVMNMGSGKKNVQKAVTPVNNNKANKKNTPTPTQKQSTSAQKKVASAQKQTTPASNKNVKKRQREDSDDDDEEVKSPVEKKKLVFSPETKVAPVKTPISQSKKTKVETPVTVAKKETPLKSILKKRAREEDDDDDEEEDEVVKKAKIAKPSPKQAKAIKEEPKAPETDVDVYRKAMESRNRRMLLIKKVNKKVTEEDIRGLSKDIVDVTTKVYYKSKKVAGQKVKESYGNAYLLFEDENTAVANMSMLKGATLKGEKFEIDFVGEKSEHDKIKMNNVELDSKRLFVTGFDKNNVTAEKIQAAFPSCTQVSLPRSKGSKKSKGYAFVSFANEEACKAVLREEKSIDGRQITFTYAKVLNMRKPQTDLTKTDKQLQKQAKQAKEETKKAKREVMKQEAVEEKVETVVAGKNQKEEKNKKDQAKTKKEAQQIKIKEEEEEDDEDMDDDDDDMDDDDEDDDDEDDSDDEDDDDEDDDDEDDDEDDDDEDD